MSADRAEQIVERIVCYLDDMRTHWATIVFSLETSLHREPPEQAHGWAMRAAEIVQAKTRYDQTTKMRSDLLHLLGNDPHRAARAPVVRW